MTPRWTRRVHLFLWVLIPVAVHAASAEQSDWPLRFWVNANGETGTLELSFESSGEVSGRLLDRPVTGFVAGRRLVLRRAIGARTELWEGWLRAADPDGADAFVAGTIAITEAGGTGVYPWYGLSEPDVRPDESTALRPAPPDTGAHPDAHGPEVSTPAPTEQTVAVPAPPAAKVDPPAPALQGPSPIQPGKHGWDLSGTWIAAEGRFEIVQDGRRLTVTLPDGNQQSGRFTGVTTLVVGLRRGCCNGELEGPDTIRWSDGATWRRAE